jgi:hypothetical protein
MDPMYTDTISEPKTLSIPDLDYAHDFSERTKMKGRTPGANADEKYFVNNTGTSITAPEQVVYGRQPLANIYSNLEIDLTEQLAQKGGHRVYATVYTLWHATNTVSGAEAVVPFRMTLSFDNPDASLVTQQIVEEVFKRGVSHLFATGEVSGNMLAKMLRGDLDPTK